MKKLQSLGKALSKDQQRQINGGEYRFNRAFCVCNDSSTCTPCVEANCVTTKAYAFANCCQGSAGGVDYCDVFCSNCE